MLTTNVSMRKKNLVRPHLGKCSQPSSFFKKQLAGVIKREKNFLFFDNITKQNHNNKNKENNNGRNITNNCKTTIKFNFIIKSFFCVFELENGSEYIKENEEKFVSLEK